MHPEMAGCSRTLATEACDSSAACGVAALQLPEPGGLVFVLWAGVPGEVTAALPESDKEASLALVAPYPTVQVVVPKGLFGAWQLVWAPRAPEVNDARGWFAMLPLCSVACMLLISRRSSLDGGATQTLAADLRLH